MLFFVDYIGDLGNVIRQAACTWNSAWEKRMSGDCRLDKLFSKDNACKCGFSGKIKNLINIYSNILVKFCLKESKFRIKYDLF